MPNAEITGWGKCLPPAVLSNHDLEKLTDTNDEWITTRTGIKERRLSHVEVSDMAEVAARHALACAGKDPDDIDLIVLATCTADSLIPSASSILQDKLGAHRAAAFDLNAACSGFIYGLVVGSNMIRAGTHRTVLVIGAETFSRILDWSDRGTCVLFGDGAGAVVLKAEPADGTATQRGILSTHLYSDGRHHDALYVDGGPSSTQTAGFLRMQGREVFRHAVVKMAEAIDAALEKNGLEPAQIDWLVPHQANIRIIEAMAKRLDLPRDRVVVTVDRHANTSAASIPLALAEAKADGRIKEGDLVLLEAMGGGFTWGSAVLRW